MSAERRWSDLAAAYVLEALDAEERETFEARLVQDPDLRAEVDAYREVAAAMAGEAPRHAPPPSLKARVLDEARASRPIGSAPMARGAAGGTSGAGEASTGPDAGSSGSGSGAMRWLAAAAVVAALGLGVVAQRLEQRRSLLESRLDAVEAELQETAARLADRDSLLSTFLGPDVRTVALSATDQPPSARLFWNTATSTLLVAAFNLPPAPEGRVYQLWGIPEGGSPVSLGTFQTDADGTAIVQRSLAADADFQIGAMTEEPAGGSPQPTSTPFLVGTWTGA